MLPWLLPRSLLYIFCGRAIHDANDTAAHANKVGRIYVVGLVDTQSLKLFTLDKRISYCLQPLGFCSGVSLRRLDELF